MKVNQKVNRKTNVGKSKFSTLNFQLSTLLLLAAIAVSCGNKTKTGAAADDATAGAKSAKSEQATPKEKRLPFEHGAYVEESNVMGMDLTKTVYFDHWGDWTASETKMEMEIMMGYTHKSDKLEIVKGSTHWDLDLIEKTGSTYEAFVPPAGMAAALGAAVGGKMVEGTEMKDLGEEDYLGYKCKKTQVKYAQMEMDVTILAYGNLTMKMDGKMGKSTISTKITSIDLSAPPASIFEVPDSIEVVKN